MKTELIDAPRRSVWLIADTTNSIELTQAVLSEER
ncbi:hypothetical protein LDFHOB_12065 [Candidatus Electronema aureum]